ncbi:MAG: UDP-N-acetylglucosamine--N-acetylmuramyl-(pentapeptide) pyrophosphoryl-undecaprenol N-acetylglucosamine transferase [Candidatus Promineifilaceae bacterium]|jgi:UDP-N-acetylglucosamine--N-acetylmuramyl-(pentapeptide) pyrophosphoryl-undecaprenol N-acetylglucosamine transferase
MKIGIACGGTGGHLFPGIAVGHVLLTQGHEVTLWVSGRDVEADGLRQWPAQTITVSARGFGGGVFAKVATCFFLTRAIIQSWRIMRRGKPDALLAMGSYASVGPVLAASLLRVPVVLHEANATPGKAVMFLARFAREVCTTFDVTESLMRGRAFRCTGLPIRGAGTDVARRLPERDGGDPLCVLVMGGSQGAAVLNSLLPRVMGRLQERGVAIRSIHLTGADRDVAVRAAYEELGVASEVMAFCNDMPRSYAAADLAICRAGAATCCELAQHQLPSILVPHPSAGGGHQRLNAESMQTQAAARLMDQSAMTEDALSELVGSLLGDPDQRASMQQALATMARPGAARDVADRLLHYAKGA